MYVPVKVTWLKTTRFNEKCMCVCVLQESPKIEKKNVMKLQSVKQSCAIEILTVVASNKAHKSVAQFTSQFE